MIRFFAQRKNRLNNYNFNKFGIVFLLIFFSLSNLNAQTFVGSGGSIQDFDTTIYSQAVTSLPFNKLCPQYGLKSVEINLTHTYLQNLQIYLFSPDGSFVNLAFNTGGASDNLIGTIFTDTASENIQTASLLLSPFTGFYKPNQSLGNLNNYQNGNGEWKLFIRDDSPGDTGALISWKLNFGTNVIGVSDSFSSNIPLVYINTFFQAPRVDSMISGFARIVDKNGVNRNCAADSILQYIGHVDLKVRGNFSLNFPQRSYSLELKDANHNDTSVALMGMPAESDWILMNTWNDRSLLRNPLVYAMHNKMGHYATRTKYCEVFLNGEYLGIYQFTEKIKRDKNRVDISKLKDTDLAGDSLTGGYIFKHDYVIDTLGWTSDIAPLTCTTNFANYQYVYPTINNIKPEQATYLRSYVDSFEQIIFSPDFADSIKGYRKYIDVESFADYLICNEFAWNGDGFSKSMYFYKDRDSKNGKLYAGPVWDFDWSLKKMPWVNDSIDIWSYKTNRCNNFQATLPWFDIMMEDTFFQNVVRCRYEYFRRNFLNESVIYAYIDSVNNLLQESQIRHYNKWPTWGLSLGTPEQMNSGNMQQELDTLKAMIHRRLIYLDINLPGICLNPLEVNGQILQNNLVQIFPNPATNHFYIQSEKNIQEVSIYNSLGQLMYQKYNINSEKIDVDVANYSKGLYLIKTKSNNEYFSSKIIKE